MRIALIVDRYGDGVAGGAESQARGFAQEAVRQGWAVEVWTTCARSHYSWENAYPAGNEEIDGVFLRRFPVTDWDPGRRAGLEISLAAKGTLPTQDQYGWLETGAHSRPLYEHAARCARDFDAVVALPYAMPMIHYALWAAQEGRTVLWPCLHNESYAYMEPVRLLLESVWGVMFNSPEEAELAIRVLGVRPRRYGVLGEGVTLATPTQRMGQEPFLLYVGRLEEGKNLALLYQSVQRYWDKGSRTKLVVLGSGPFTPPHHPAFEYRGAVGEQEKADTCARALALCQPSLNESFSLTIMESWLAGRPVLVHGDCAVTRGHVRRSKGGLWFRTYEEFQGVVDWLRGHSGLADRMGSNGKEYVLRNYQWRHVTARFERMLHSWQAGEGLEPEGGQR